MTILGSGSSGNALIVHGRDGDILVDAGFSLRDLVRRMDSVGVDASRLKGIVVSHEHRDHTNGLDVIARRLGVPVFCNASTAAALRHRGAMDYRLNLFTTGRGFAIDEFSITPFSIPHDAMDPVGLVVEANGHRLGLATDLGHASSVVLHHLQGCHILVVESNHDLTMLRQSDRPWRLKQRILSRHGHLSNDDSLALVRRILHPQTSHLILAHLSGECNRHDLVEAGIRRELGALNRLDIHPHVAIQEEAAQSFWATR